MEDTQLPPPGDSPEKLLSPEAKWRIAVARFESMSIRSRARADADFEFSRSGKPDTDFASHLRTSPAYRAGVIESIRVVLSAIHREFATLAFPRLRRYELFVGEIENIVASARDDGDPVVDHDVDAFALEFLHLTAGAITDEPTGIIQNAPPPIHAREGNEQKKARRRAAIDPILNQKGLSVYRWERSAGVTEKIGSRYLNGKTTPRVGNRGKLARALGIAELPP